MDVERETIVEALVSGVVVVGFIVAVLLVGTAFGSDGMGQQGALSLVGLIVGFILVMSAAGYWLSARGT